MARQSTYESNMRKKKKEKRYKIGGPRRSYARVLSKKK